MVAEASDDEEEAGSPPPSTQEEYVEEAISNGTPPHLPDDSPSSPADEGESIAVDDYDKLALDVFDFWIDEFKMAGKLTDSCFSCDSKPPSRDLSAVILRFLTWKALFFNLYF